MGTVPSNYGDKFYKKPTKFEEESTTFVVKDWSEHQEGQPCNTKVQFNGKTYCVRDHDVQKEFEGSSEDTLEAVSSD